MLHGVGVRARKGWDRSQLARFRLLEGLHARPLRRVPRRALPPDEKSNPGDESLNPGKSRDISQIFEISPHFRRPRGNISLVSTAAVRTHTAANGDSTGFDVRR